MASNLSFDSGPTAQPRQPPQPPPRRPPRPQAEPRQPHHTPGIDSGIRPFIRQSAARLSRNEDAFIQQLHYDVTGLTEDRAGSQAPGAWAFCERMVHALLWVALTDQPLPVVIDALREVGAQNWAEGFSDADYGNFAHALVQTLHYLSDSDWSASTGSAWISYFMWIKPHLLAGAQYAATRHAAAQQAAGVTALAGDNQVVANVNAESVANLLEDEDDEDTGYGQIMLGMTRAPRRPPALIAT